MEIAQSFKVIEELHGELGSPAAGKRRLEAERVKSFFKFEEVPPAESEQLPILGALENNQNLPEEQQFQIKLKHIMKLASLEARVADDSIENELVDKRIDNVYFALQKTRKLLGGITFNIGNIILKPSMIERTEEGLNEIDVEEKRIQEEAENSSDDEMMEKSIIFQRPEINIRFNSKFTDDSKYTTKQQLKILEVVFWN